jgi:hypothetical protein
MENSLLLQIASVLGATPENGTNNGVLKAILVALTGGHKVVASGAVDPTKWVDHSTYSSMDIAIAGVLTTDTVIVTPTSSAATAGPTTVHINGGSVKANGTLSLTTTTIIYMGAYAGLAGGTPALNYFVIR